MPANIQLTYPIMILTFKKPVAIAVDRLNSFAPDYISAARLDPDGKSIRIALARKVKFNSIPAAEQLYIDLLPETWSGLPPGLPREVIEDLAKRALDAERQLRVQRITAKAEKKPAAIRVKVATQPTFTRYVFAMPDLANVVARKRERKADARIRSADQMGSVGCQGGNAADGAIDRRRPRRRFGRPSPLFSTATRRCELSARTAAS